VEFLSFSLLQTFGTFIDLGHHTAQENISILTSVGSDKKYSKTHQKQKAELVATCRKNVK
jgi:hypothetical protein